MGTGYDLRSLGQSNDSETTISEEERENHLHILGTTGEGKSRLIEHLIRGDIRNGNGVCLLDPSDRAETAYSILRYCASIGFEKVCLIDHNTIHTHNRVACIQPFNCKPSYKEAVVSNVMDTMRILFDMKDMAHYSFVQQYLPALIKVLWNAKMTLYEAKYFTRFKNPVYQFRRGYILKQNDDFDDDKITIQEAFESIPNFKEFGSTARRLLPLFHPTLELMFGAKEGISFTKMITEGWVILVNLYSGLGFEPMHTRLVGTTVINELIFAMDRIIERNKRYGADYKVPFYLYIDEAGRYANANLAEALSYRRKSNFRVTIAHQYFSQFNDKTVLDAVKNQCKTKIMFDTPGYEDRLQMIKSLGYGGDIPHELANYANSNLPKQTAIIKKPKQSPVRIKIVNVPQVKLPKGILQDFVSQLLTNPWNKTPEEINNELKSRFPTAPNPPRSEPRKTSDWTSDGPTLVSEGILERRKKSGLSKGDEKPKRDGKERPIKI